ncbi:Capsule polysaccharide biosynthesis, partial [Candidatus Magnetomorum sp. HK-1]
MKKILLFSPYGLWQVHSQVDVMIGAALRLRGCEVISVCCDGVFENCPIAKVNQEQMCKQCSMMSNNLFSNFKIPIIFLKKLLSDELILQLKSWVQNIPVDKLYKTKLGQNEIGKWIIPSILSYFTCGKPDFSNPEFVKIYRSFLLNSSLIVHSFGKLLDSFKPDHVICYSGIHCYYKIAYELARQKNIKTLIHERGTIDSSFTFLENGGIVSYQHRIDCFENWRNIPLNITELEWVKEYIQNREKGKNINWHSSYTYSSEDHLIYKALRIPLDSKIITIFTSHNWEYGILTYETYVTFKSQIAGMKYIIESLKDKHYYLIIRLHPPMGHTVLLNNEFIDDLLSQLYYDLPSNVRIVMPNEKMTAYSLLWSSEAVITFSSTIGLEALFKGTYNIGNVKNLYSTVTDPVTNYKEYDKIVDEAVKKTKNFKIDYLKTAYRAIFYLFRRINFQFKTFGIKNFHEPDIRIKNIKEIEEGQDIILDQICKHVMYGDPLYLIPGKVELKRSEDVEDLFLSKELEFIKKKRQETKKQISMHPYYEPLITVSIISQNKITSTQSTFFYKSLQRSRHKNIKINKKDQIIFHDLKNLELKTLLQKLEVSVANSESGYIYIASDNIHIDESLFSNSIDFLEKSENNKYHAVVTGAFVCNKDNKIVDQLFANESDGDQYNYLKDNTNFDVTNYSQLLSFFVWRKDSLLKLISELKKDQNNKIDFNYELIFEKILSTNATFCVYKSMIPNIVIYSYHDTEEDQLGLTDQKKPLGKTTNLNSIHKPEPEKRNNIPLCFFYTTYDQVFIESFYHKNRELLSKSYTTQKKHIFAECFGESNFYSKGLQKAGWNTENFIINCQPLQSALTKENNFSGNSLEIIIEQIRRFTPEVVYLHNLEICTAEFIVAIRPYTKLIVGQIDTPISPNTYIKGFDIIFSSFPHFVKKFREAGITAYYQSLSFAPQILSSMPKTHRHYPLAFIGSISTEYRNEENFLEKFAEKNSIDFWGDGIENLPDNSFIRQRHHGKAWGLDML